MMEEAKWVEVDGASASAMGITHNLWIWCDKFECAPCLDRCRMYVIESAIGFVANFHIGYCSVCVEDGGFQKCPVYKVCEIGTGSSPYDTLDNAKIESELMWAQDVITAEHCDVYEGTMSDITEAIERRYYEMRDAGRILLGMFNRTRSK